MTHNEILLILRNSRKPLIKKSQMPDFFTTTANIRDYIRTDIVFTEEKPYPFARGKYMSFWLYKPSAAGNTDGSLHRCFLEYFPDKLGEKVERSAINEYLSRDAALAFLIEAEDDDKNCGRALVDTTLNPYSSFMKEVRYHELAHEPLECLRRTRHAKAISEKAASSQTGMNIRKFRPR